ncbi:MAG TPA: signal peptide peptidase SppA, partial [Myxococcaceae bacterium]|nr:signal peptide peptidase SppA [Myxococcaceae bacterium]
SLQDAIDAARREAGIPDREPYDVVVVGEPRGLASAIGGSPLANILPVREPLPSPVKTVLEELGVPPSVLLQPGPRAMMEFRLQVQ